MGEKRCRCVADFRLKHEEKAKARSHPLYPQPQNLVTFVKRSQARKTKVKLSLRWQKSGETTAIESESPTTGEFI